MGEPSSPWATVVCLVVDDLVYVVLVGTIAASEGVKLGWVEEGVR